MSEVQTKVQGDTQFFPSGTLSFPEILSCCVFRIQLSFPAVLSTVSYQRLLLNIFLLLKLYGQNILNVQMGHIFSFFNFFQILNDYPEELRGDVSLHLHREILNLPIFETASEGCR